MDADRFDTLTRLLAGMSARRRLLARAATLFSLLPLVGGMDGAVAKRQHKPKKKKCKGTKKRCGKRCIPKASCCVACGSGGACLDGACACLAGFRLCKGTCIPEGDCCTNTDCAGGAICVGGRCGCLAGFKLCGEACIALDACCTADDCDSGNPCVIDNCTAGACEQDLVADGTVCGAPCGRCQDGACMAQCGAGETCLGNGGCGTTCVVHEQCPGCTCNMNNEGESVCRTTIGSPATVQCGTYDLCTNTADCDPGHVCSSICNPKRCVPLC
jgi:hypothetical protein